MIAREQALQSLADFLSERAEQTAAITPREAAESAWHPGGPSVDGLTTTITASRTGRGASPAATDDASLPPGEPRLEDPHHASDFPLVMAPKTLAMILEVTTLTLQRWRHQGKGRHGTGSRGRTSSATPVLPPLPRDQRLLVEHKFPLPRRGISPLGGHPLLMPTPDRPSVQVRPLRRGGQTHQRSLASAHNRMVPPRRKADRMTTPRQHKP